MLLFLLGFILAIIGLWILNEYRNGKSMDDIMNIVLKKLENMKEVQEVNVEKIRKSQIMDD
jgi:hypothetical protein